MSDTPLTARLAADIGKLIDLVEAQAATIASHGADLATAQKAVDTANANVATLQKQVDDLQAKLDTEVDQAPLEGLATQIEAITNTTTESASPATPPAPTPDAPAPSVATVTNPTPTTTVAVVPAAADPVTVPTAAGSVTVDPGTTMHVDDSTGVATTVPHDGTDPTAVTSVGTPVAPDPSVVAAAIVATTDAGVAVPAAPAA